jgi:hypothetical protein
MIFAFKKPMKFENLNFLLIRVHPCASVVQKKAEPGQTRTETDARRCQPVAFLHPCKSVFIRGSKKVSPRLRNTDGGSARSELAGWRGYMASSNCAECVADHEALFLHQKACPSPVAVRVMGKMDGKFFSQKSPLQSPCTPPEIFFRFCAKTTLTPSGISGKV